MTGFLSEQLFSPGVSGVGRIQGAFSDPCTHPAMWGRTVCASRGPCVVTPQWWHSHLSFLCVVFLDNLSPAGGTFYLCQEPSACEEEIFLFTFTPCPITLFSSLCTHERILSCPICSGAAECENTILGPAELAAHWGAPCRAKGCDMLSWLRWNKCSRQSSRAVVEAEINHKLSESQVFIAFGVGNPTWPNQSITSRRKEAFPLVGKLCGCYAESNVCY